MRKVFIIRGLPGSGKSSVAEQLHAVFEDSVLVSADQYMYENGKYVFHVSKLANAHHLCQQDFKRAMAKYTGHIIVDNTNIELRRVKWYADQARRKGYIVISCTIEDFDVDACHRRTKHSVPKEIVAKMARSFQR